MSDDARPAVATWRVEDAAGLGALVDRALSEGPQLVTRDGRPAAVLVSAEEWERRGRGRPDDGSGGGDLVDFFAASPFREEGIEIERLGDVPREIGL